MNAVTYWIDLDVVYGRYDAPSIYRLRQLLSASVRWPHNAELAYSTAQMHSLVRSMRLVAHAEWLVVYPTATVTAGLLDI